MNQDTSRPSPVKVLTRKAGSLLIDIGQKLRARGLRTPVPAAPSPGIKRPGEHLALVAGYFSFPDGYATFGDTAALSHVEGWLQKAGVRYDVACHQSNGRVGVELKDVDPSNYDIFVFVCGPWKANNIGLLQRFSHCLKVGVDLSIEDQSAAELFDLLYPRDMGGQHNPDIVVSTVSARRRLLGVCLVHTQAEYGARQRHERVHAMVEQYLEESGHAYIFLDTLHRANKYGIPSQTSFESLLSRLDAVITSRLHGAVFSLKQGVPFVAIDPVAGGAKVTAQAKALGWPYILSGDLVTTNQISEMVDSCLRPEARSSVDVARDAAIKTVASIESRFISDVVRSLSLG